MINPHLGRFIALIALAPIAAYSQDEPATDTAPDLPDPELAPEEMDPWITPDPLAPVLAPYRDAQSWLADHGFELTLGTTLIYQHATDTVGGADDQWFTASYDIEGVWTLLQDDRIGRGAIGFLVEGGEIFDHDDAFDLSANTGSLYGVNADADGQDIAITELWYQHQFGDETLLLTVGKIDQTAFFDQNAIANDETIQFLSGPLVNNPAIAFPDRGLGANVWWNITDAESHGFGSYVTAGFGDANADSREAGFDTFEGGEIFYAVEAGVSPTLPGVGTGNYRFIFWHTEVEDADGGGFAVSFDQSLAELLPNGPELVPFFRYGTADDEVAEFEQLVSVGLGINAPLGRRSDLLGIGYVWGEPAGDDTDDQQLVEVFYRLQLTETIGITPDAQLIFDPADDDIDDPVAILGVRVQATF